MIGGLVSQELTRVELASRTRRGEQRRNPIQNIRFERELGRRSTDHDGKNRAERVQGSPLRHLLSPIAYPHAEQRFVVQSRCRDQTPGMAT